MNSKTDILPTYYYHDHFLEMIDFVTRVYADVLTPSDHEFIDAFKSLGTNAQCLFIRLCNRKKPAFHFDDLHYTEISVVDALDELQEYSFTRALTAEDYLTFLSTLSKHNLVEIARRENLSNYKVSWKKNQLIELIHASVSFESFQLIFDITRHFVPMRRVNVQYLLYLYFGKVNGGMTPFALRDLGVISVNKKEAYSARFQDTQEAQAGFYYAQAIATLKTASSALYVKLTEDMDIHPSASSEYVNTLRDKFIHTLGIYFERAKDIDHAIRIYSYATSFSSRERLVRLLYAKGKKEEVKLRLDQIIANPSSEEEYLFAVDFYARKFDKQKNSMLTELLRSSQSIHVDEVYRGAPENAVIQHFKKQGWSGRHTENYLWNSLFGIIFWDELFELTGTLSSGFDYTPQILRNKQFHIDFSDQIEIKLNRIRNNEALSIVRSSYVQNQQKPNSIFMWFDGLLTILSEFLKVASGYALADMLAMMAQDFYGTRDGFPDLMLICDNQIKFLEVKAEGDQLRRNQLTRMLQLQRSGFDVEICRVGYYVDPDQSYVVVDVETTGSRAPLDRVTEIGAVKVRNGQIIDEWSSLINPDKHIPAFITQLTGIDDEMVRDAPRFAEIAKEFSSFIEGSVFVAHNVNFDYGCITSEFRRIGLSFHYPKLCTVASMRKYYPGHGSYSLGNICREYGINLKSHHRALCDATAAAELLLLVQSKRIEHQNSSITATITDTVG